jgi:DNA-binding GntR family transcriptional regulator
VEPALHDHYAIVNAINDRDPELAEILMRRHISSAWKILENLLNQEEIKE